MLIIHTTEDPCEALRIAKSLDMALCLNEITTAVRKKHLKYNDKYTEEQLEVVQAIFDDIFETIKEYGINLDDLTDR